MAGPRTVVLDALPLGGGAVPAPLDALAAALVASLAVGLYLSLAAGRPPPGAGALAGRARHPPRRAGGGPALGSGEVYLKPHPAVHPGLAPCQATDP
jgi:hypothetical protein